MFEFHPYITNDGSVGLYNSEYNDIYHSATGALTEAYEKFVYPINFDILMSNEQIKILDICYGIGYNSKSFLNYFFEKFLKTSEHANSNIYPIHTNNLGLNNCVNNDTIYSNNISNKISVTAIDNDKILAFLSPFIKTGIKNIKNFQTDFKYSKIDKYFDKNNNKNFSSKKINDLINYFLYEKIAQNAPEIYNCADIIRVLEDKKYNNFINKDIKGIFMMHKNINSIIVDPNYDFILFLHNIYYRHVSDKYKKRLKCYNFNNINFNFKHGDARKIISDIRFEFDIIFLDAFTPSKCPCLWSLDFFKLLFKHLTGSGIILTYSTSAAVRNAMVNAGFFIGNIYNERENKFTGTIAVKNKELIKYPLSEFDLGLLNTRAGIFYRDENLTGQNEAINCLRKSEVENSNRMSSSEYKKKYLLNNCPLDKIQI